MNWIPVNQVFTKDLQELRKNRSVFLSLIFLPALLVVVSIINVYSQVSSQPVSIPTLSTLVTIFSTFIILIPAIVSVLVGATSVVIEKNNRSLEPLLATPITDGELLFGKALVPFALAMILGYTAYAVDIAALDYLTYPVYNAYILPTHFMLYLMFVMTPLIAMFGTFVALFVSTKVKDIRAAQQVSTLTVIPLFLLLIIGSVALASTTFFLLIITFVLIVAVVGFATLTVKAFNRENILVSWK